MKGLPEVSPSENWNWSIELAGRIKPAPRKQRGKRRPSIVELLDRAEAMRAAIACEGVNRAELARRAGVTRARVTQLLRLLDLAPEVRAEVRRLAGSGTAISERRLRPLVGRGPNEQLAVLRRPTQPRPGRSTFRDEQDHRSGGQ